MARRRGGDFKRKGAAVAFFVLALAALVVATYVGIGMLTRYDYTDVLPEDAPLRARFPEDGDYSIPEPTPRPAPVVTPTPLPTRMPPPASTPMPLSMYSVQNARMMMPKDASAAGEGQLTSIQVSEADGQRSVVVTGWAFLDGFDAQHSRIYLVTSPRSSSGQRFYEAQVLPGSSGVQHPPERGENLERADFRAVFSVRAYEDGPYKLGMLVVNRDGREAVNGYFEAGAGCQLTVKAGAVAGVG
ncbi:hypothetical protein ACH6CV_00670 [Bacillota bacterium Meth-B3]|nr:hypothetical protein [Christensenellaceae bacterium]MEA5069334.1 hypothetical protein [Christensenellaceae bacterium]